MQDMEQAIREPVHYMWVDAGRPDGNSDAFWLTAQREVLSSSLSQIAKVKATTPKKAAKPKDGARKRKACVASSYPMQQCHIGRKTEAAFAANAVASHSAP
jgi:hypothetical protein